MPPPNDLILNRLTEDARRAYARLNAYQHDQNPPDSPTCFGSFEVNHLPNQTLDRTANGGGADGDACRAAGQLEC